MLSTFKGAPYDSSTYYASGLSGAVGDVRNELFRAVSAGGINGVDVQPCLISVSFFSGTREYLAANYGGVYVYVLIVPFGQDLYASWISFFKLGCLQRLARLGSPHPNDLDVDDLEMLGQGIDVYLRAVLDRAICGAGYGRQETKRVLAGARRKKFVKG
jgi:hypothetical protein